MLMVGGCSMMLTLGEPGSCRSITEIIWSTWDWSMKTMYGWFWAPSSCSRSASI